MKIEIKDLGKSKIEIIGELEADKFKTFWGKAIKELSNNVKIDGFRTGNIPENILIKNVGEDAILHEAAEIAMRETYPSIVIENKLHVIGRPEIVLTKIAKDNPLGFKITTSVMPKIDLPDYKKMAKETGLENKDKKIEVEDKEVDDVINQIRKSRAVKHDHENNDEKDETKKEEELPALDDTFAKSLGQFNSVEDLKNKIKENLVEEKTARAKQELRMKILEKIAENTKVEMPEILIESETDRIITETKGQLGQLGLNFDDYLKSSKKTIEDLRKESRDAAEKRAKLNLLLKKIASEEKLTLLPEEVELEVQNILDQYKGADPDSARMYIEDIMINEKVFNLLETQSE